MKYKCWHLYYKMWFFYFHFALFSYLAIIGPPGMQIEALAKLLHIRFLAPKIETEHETWTMKNIYNSWAYNVQYWKNGSDEKVSLANCTYFRHRLPVLCSVLAWDHDRGERRLGGHLIRVLQGASTQGTQGSKAWSSKYQEFPAWEKTNIPDSRFTAPREGCRAYF